MTSSNDKNPLWALLLISGVVLVALWAGHGQLYSDDDRPIQTPQLSDPQTSTPLGSATSKPDDEGVVTGVRLSTLGFNPTSESVTLHYNLKRSANVTVRVWDLDGGLAWESAQEQQDAGEHQVVWDGKDVDGHTVPDSAWMFTIEDKDAALYDPWTFSGGDVGDVTNVVTDPLSHALRYHLPQPARVLVRLGVKDGPMHKTLVDWKPRLPGPALEPWDGMDESKVVELYKRPRYTGIVTYVTLPDATVITSGNSGLDYRSYRLGPAKDRANRPKPNRQNGDPPAPQDLVPPALRRAPKVVLELPKQGTANPEYPQDGIAEVRVDTHPDDRAALLGSQFEIMFYVDDQFFAEAERGTLPYFWKWELQRLPPGPHVLTTNLVSMDGQVGTASLKITIKEDAP